MDVSSQDDPIGVNDEKVQSILDNHVIRKLFYNWVNLQRKLASRTATVRFLEECANSKLVPDRFRVKIYWRNKRKKRATNKVKCFAHFLA